MALRRGIAALVIALIGLPLLVFAAVVVFLYMIATRGPSVPDQATLVLRPGGKLLDVRPDDIVGQLAGRDVTTLRGLVESLRKAKRDPRITAVVLRPSALELPFWAKVQELRDAVARFPAVRKDGRRVSRVRRRPRVLPRERGRRRCFCCRRARSISPASRRTRSSCAARSTRSARIPTSCRSDRTRPRPISSPSRSSRPRTARWRESLNRDMYEQLVRGIAEARRKSDEEVRALLDEGPFSPEARSSAQVWSTASPTWTSSTTACRR